MRNRWSSLTICLFGFGALLIAVPGVQSASSASENERIPYVVSLENEGGQFCAGSVIGAKWILTVASCVWDKSPSEISVGVQPSSVESNGHHESIYKIYFHPDLNPSSLQTSMALLKLKRAIVWNERTPTVEVLPHDQTSLEEVNKCLLIGWDRNINAPPVQAERVDLLPRERCGDESSSGLCFNGSVRRLCEFHRGSPLLCQYGEEFKQVAMLAAGSGKECSYRHPSDVLVNVASVSEWIVGVISGNSEPKAGKAAANEGNYPLRLSQFNWLIIAISFFIISVTIFIKVLKSGFTVL